MLSRQRILQMLGRDILIEPFEDRLLKGIGYNLCVGPHAWSLRHSARLPEVDGSFVVEPGDTALVLTRETVWVSKRIAGTFHSKVDRMSEGFSAISTTLDPEYIGPLLIAITNLSGQSRYLTVGESFATIVFHRIEKAKYQGQLNPSARIDRLNRLGITLSKAELDWINEGYRQNVGQLRRQVVDSSSVMQAKKLNLVNYFWSSYFLPFTPAILAFCAFFYLAQSAAPQQQLGPIIAGVVVAIGSGINTIIARGAR